MGVGRPTKYQANFAARAKALAEQGATDREMAHALGIGETTLYRWQSEFREFREAIKVGKAPADDRVEMALYRKATGYSFDAEKIFQYEGEPVRVEYVEHVPPSDTAAIFWLKNRRKDEWRDKQEVEHGITGSLAELLTRIDGRTRTIVPTPEIVE